MDVFPSFWDAFRAANDAGQVHIVEEVAEELRPQDTDDELRQWLLDNNFSFHPIEDELQQLVDSIQQENEAFARQGASKTLWADPWVIALAETSGHVVVTEEAVEARKIPGICRNRSVPCTNALGFIRELGLVL
jgi:hypothetical protein